MKAPLLLACVLATAACGWIRDGRWQVYQKEGTQAFTRRRYDEAEVQWKAALALAERFGMQDPRLGTTLDSLAQLYVAQGRYAEAEPLYVRAQQVWEASWGPHHPAV